MFGLYDAAGHVFQKNILDQHPVILGLFSAAGGRFILYRPGMGPLETPPVPIVYRLARHKPMFENKVGIEATSEDGRRHTADR